MPKRYKLEITALAEQDILDIRRVIAADKPVAADRWVRVVGKHAKSLRQLPYRYEEAPEAEESGLPLRHIIFGNYRIIYVVDETRVRIVRVVHAAQVLHAEMFTDEA